MPELVANVSALCSQSCTHFCYSATATHTVTLRGDSLQFCYLTITKEIRWLWTPLAVG